MILRHLAAPLALLMLLGSASTAHAGWYRLRGDKQEQSAKRQQLKKQQDELRRQTEAKQKEDAERLARQQRVLSKGNAKIYSSQVPSSNYRPVRTERQIVTLAMKLGGSRRIESNVSTTRALLLRNQGSKAAPVFGWKTTARLRNQPGTGAPQLFAFNRY